MKFILSTDTCCDDFKTNFKKQNIKYFPMKFICDDIEYEDTYNSAEDYQTFYKEMNEGKHYKTSGVNVEEIKEYFSNILEETNLDIIHIALSSGLSCTFDNAKIAADELNVKSDKKIYVIDSLSATVGMNVIVNKARNYRDENKTAEETYSLIINVIKRNNVSFFINDLEHLRRGGRISGVAAALGKIANIKPILQFDDSGKLEIISKVIGSKKAVISLYDRIKNNYDGESEIIIVRAEDETLAFQLRDLVQNTFPNATISIKYIGPMICSHTGPSLVGMVFLQK